MTAEAHLSQAALSGSPTLAVQEVLRSSLQELDWPRTNLRLLVAFSGGNDSTALLAALMSLRKTNPVSLDVVAAHYDHGWDTKSPERAQYAAELAQSLGASCFIGRGKGGTEGKAQGRDGLEATARTLRYDFLEDKRRQTGCERILTAHHLEDQTETLLLRLLYGSGIEGMAGIRPKVGAVARPLLSVSKDVLRDCCLEQGLSPVLDPTNPTDITSRNRLRNRVLPKLRARNPGLDLASSKLALSTQRAMARLEQVWERTLGPSIRVEEGDAVSLPLDPLEALPAPAKPLALNWLHRKAGAPRPPTLGARKELERQLGQRKRTNSNVSIACGNGWRWQVRQNRLQVQRPPRT